MAEEPFIRGLEHVVLVVTHPQVAVLTNYRIQVHIVLVDVAVTLASCTVPLHQIAMLFFLSRNELAPLLNSGLLSLFVVSCAIQASKRQVEGTIILYIGYARLSNVGSYAVLSLVLVDDFLLCDTELLTSVVLVGVLPSIELTGHFVVNIRPNNLNVGSSSV